MAGILEFPLARRLASPPPPEKEEGNECTLYTLDVPTEREREHAEWLDEMGYGKKVRRRIAIPTAFWEVEYNAAHFPGAPDTNGLEGGANCQQFAYELLRANGYVIGDMRSSELWADKTDTMRARGRLEGGDLLLFHFKADAWGAHVAVYVGEDRAIHLAQRIGKPAIWAMSEFLDDPLYRHFIGAKRPIRRQA